MKRYSGLIALVAIVSLVAPTAVFAQSFQVENQTAAWVLLSVNSPSQPTQGPPPSAVCIAPKGSQVLVTPAHAMGSVYFIALSGNNCYAPRLWEHGVTIDGKGSVVTIGHAATVEHNAGDVVRVENTSDAWVLTSVNMSVPPKQVVPAQTSWCIAPGGRVTTHGDFVPAAKAYIIVLAHNDCAAPRLFEGNAAGDRIVVSDKNGTYSLHAP